MPVIVEQPDGSFKKRKLSTEVSIKGAPGDDGADGFALGWAYFLQDSNSNISGYKQWTRELNPSGHNHSITGLVVGSGITPIEEYATNVGDPQISFMRYGVWRFQFYYYVDVIGFYTRFYVRLFKRASGGSEVQLFESVSPELTVLGTTTLLTWDYTHPDDEPLLPTDRLVLKVYAATNSSSPVEVRVYGGASFASLVQTQIFEGAQYPYTLDFVADNGNTTDQDLKAQNLYVNWDGPDGDSYVYFYEGSLTGQYLKWDNTTNSFVFSRNELGVNFLAADLDAIIRFYKPTSGSQTLRWDKTNNYFKFDADLYIDGDLTVTGTINGTGLNLTLQDVTDDGNTTTNDIKIQNLYINFDGAAQVETQFVPTFAYYKDPDNTPTSSTFTVSVPAAIDGNLSVEAVAFSVNKDSSGFDLGMAKTVTKLRRYDGNSASDNIYLGGGFDSLAVYYSNDNSTWTLLQNFNPVTRIDTGIGNVHYVELVLSVPTSARYWKMHASENAIAASNGDQLNLTEIQIYGFPPADEDSYIYFYEGGSATGAYLKWEDDFSRHEFSHGLHVGLDLTVSGDIKGNNLYLNYDGPDGNATIYFYDGASPTAGFLRWDEFGAKFLFSTDLDVVGLLRCDSFRIDQTPTTTISAMTAFDQYITISCNGTTYRVPVFLP